MLIGRTHITKSSVQGFLDVTTKSAPGSLGRKFAPQWAWVAGLKKREGYQPLTWAEYAERYNALLSRLPMETWKELSEFGRANGGVIHFACYCAVSSVECHTELIVQFMEANFPSCKREQLSLPSPDEKPDFRVIVCGGRDFGDYSLLKESLNHLLSKIRETHRVIIVSGCARGADSLALRYALEDNLSVEKYPADWEANGRGAGYLRNEQMLKVANGVVAFPGGKGTEHMVAIAQKKGIPTKEVKG